jgi:hypothetical protein
MEPAFVAMEGNITPYTRLLWWLRQEKREFWTPPLPVPRSEDDALAGLLHRRALEARRFMVLSLSVENEKLLRKAIRALGPAKSDARRHVALFMQYVDWRDLWRALGAEVPEAQDRGVPACMLETCRRLLEDEQVRALTRRIVTDGDDALKRNEEIQPLLRVREEYAALNLLCSELQREVTRLGGACMAGVDDLEHRAILGKRLDGFGLSVRSENCLQNAGIEYVWQLVEKTEGEMLKIKNFGRKCLNELKELLGGMGLSFKKM